MTKDRRKNVESVLQMLRNPPTALVDSPHYLAMTEERLLGVPLTCSHTQAATDRSMVDTTCNEFLCGKSDRQMTMGVEIVSYREFTVKSGKNEGRTYGRLCVCDESGSMEDVICYADVWQEFSQLLTRPRTIVAIRGKRHWDETQLQAFVIEEVLEM